VELALNNEMKSDLRDLQDEHRPEGKTGNLITMKQQCTNPELVFLSIPSYALVLVVQASWLEAEPIPVIVHG